MNQIRLAEAYARINALKAHLPEAYVVEQKYVEEFHEVLSVLEQESCADLSKFRIPESEVRPRVISVRRMRGSVTYSDRSYCERSFLMMRIDGILGFFSLQMATPKTAIGFHP